VTDIKVVYKDSNYAIELLGGRQFRQSQPRVGIAHVTVADETELTRTVYRLRAVTAYVQTYKRKNTLHVGYTLSLTLLSLLALVTDCLFNQ